MSRIWKKPTSSAGKKRLRKSANRQIRSAFRGGTKSGALWSGFLRNKTEPQLEFIRALTGDKTRIQETMLKKTRALESKANRLKEQATQRAKALQTISRQTDKNPAPNSTEGIKRLKRFGFLLSDLIEISERRRRTVWDLIQSLPEKAREEYARAYPQPSGQGLAKVRESMKEINRTLTRLENAGFVDSAQFEAIERRLYLRLISIDEQHPRRK